jgi:hypothetical protein
VLGRFVYIELCKPCEVRIVSRWLYVLKMFLSPEGRSLVDEIERRGFETLIKATSKRYVAKSRTMWPHTYLNILTVIYRMYALGACTMKHD